MITVLICGKMSYNKISQSLNATRLKIHLIEYILKKTDNL